MKGEGWRERILCLTFEVTIVYCSLHAKHASLAVTWSLTTCIIAYHSLVTHNTQGPFTPLCIILVKNLAENVYIYTYVLLKWFLWLYVLPAHLPHMFLAREPLLTTNQTVS